MGSTYKGLSSGMIVLEQTLQQFEVNTFDEIFDALNELMSAGFAITSFAIDKKTSEYQGTIYGVIVITTFMGVPSESE